MAAAFVQGTSGTQHGVSIASVTSTNFASSVVAGHLLVALVASAAGASGDVSSVTDTAGNTYTKILEFTTLNLDITVWIVWNCIGGASFNVTGHVGAVGTNDASIVVQEFSGVMRSANPFDKSKSATGTSTSPNSGATATTTQATELIVGVLAHESTTTTIVTGSGYSALTTASLANCSAALESQVVAVTGAQTATFGLTASRPWGCGVVTIKDSAGDPKTKGGTLMLMGIG